MAENNTRWITDIDPVYDGTYIVTIKREGMEAYTGTSPYDLCSGEWLNSCVVAWMPFPKPYKEQQNEKMDGCCDSHYTNSSSNNSVMKLGELLDKISDDTKIKLLVEKTEMMLTGTKDAIECMVNEETMNMGVVEIDCDREDGLKIFLESIHEGHR